MPIPDRAEKLQFLKKSALAQQVGRHTGSENDFADAIDVSRSTATDWIKGHTHRSTIPTDTSNKIAERFRFPSADWDPWLTKSAAVFIAEYEKLAKRLLDEPSPLPQPRFTDRPLQQGPDRDIDRGPIRGLCSIELTCGNTGRGETVIGVRIACGNAIIPISPFPITVSVGRFEIDCGLANATVDSCKGATGGARFNAEGNSGAVYCKWDGDFKRPAWTLFAAGSSIGTLVFEPGILAKIVDLAPGDVIKGTFGTWLKDIASDESGQPRIDDITIVDRLGERPELQEHQLSILQRKIIEHLRKSVLSLDAEGFAILSSHELHFIERTGS